MKVIELVQCLLWGIGVMIPIISAMAYESATDKGSPWGAIAVVSQILFGVACYKAGGGFQ